MDLMVIVVGMPEAIYDQNLSENPLMFAPSFVTSVAVVDVGRPDWMDAAENLVIENAGVAVK